MATVSSILDTVAVGLDAADAAVGDPKASAVIKGTASLIRLLSNVTKDRSAEEAIIILQQIRDHGVQGLDKDRLDAQLKAALDKAAQGG